MHELVYLPAPRIRAVLMVDGYASTGVGMALVQKFKATLSTRPVVVTPDKPSEVNPPATTKPDTNEVDDTVQPAATNPVASNPLEPNPLETKTIAPMVTASMKLLDVHVLFLVSFLLFLYTTVCSCPVVVRSVEDKLWSISKTSPHECGPTCFVDSPAEVDDGSPPMLRVTSV